MRSPRKGRKILWMDRKTDGRTNDQGWLDGLMDPRKGEKMVFRASDRWTDSPKTLQWCHNECDGVSNHRRHDYLLNRVCLFMCRSTKTSKLRVTGLCGGNSRLTGEFPAQRASNAENVSIWWRHHDIMPLEPKDRGIDMEWKKNQQVKVSFLTSIIETSCWLE